MIKQKYKVGLAVFVASIAFWLLDSALDSIFFFKKPFLDTLIGDVSIHEVFMRLSEVALFIICIFLVFKYSLKSKKSEDKYSHLFNNINDAIFVSPISAANIPGNFVEVNDEACKRLGYTREELLKLSPQDVNIPEDVRQIPERVQSLIANGHVLFETIHLAKDGRQIPVEVNVHLVDFQGKPTILAIARDITDRHQAQEALQRVHEELEQRVVERTAELTMVNQQLLREMEEHQQTEEKLRESEARFRTLFQTAGSVIILTDSTDSILEFNPEAERVLGWSRAEALGKNAIELLIPAMARDTAKMGTQRILNGSVAKGSEFTIQRRDGKERVFLWNVNPLYDGQGQSAAIVSVGHDITERKQAEQALQESEQTLRSLTSRILTIQEDERRLISQELHEEMGQTLLGMKLLIGSIKEKMRKGKPSKDHQSIMEDCDQLGQSIQAMVENIRQLSRNLSPAILEDLGLPAALKNLCDEFCKQHKNITDCYCRVIEVDGLLSKQDQINIYRIVQESLANISKHSDASQMRLAIDRQPDHLSFVLEDNGKGFDPEELQLRPPRADGLGLAALEERVRILGGTLQIEGKKGVGTRVVFDVPLKKMVNGDNGQGPAEPEPPDSSIKITGWKTRVSP